MLYNFRIKCMYLDLIQTSMQFLSHFIKVIASLCSHDLFYVIVRLFDNVNSQYYNNMLQYRNNRAIRSKHRG